MALNFEEKRPFYSSMESTLRLGLFVAHAASSIVMLLKGYRVFGDNDCANNVFLSSRMVIASDPYLQSVHPQVYPLKMNRIHNLTSCANDTSWNKGVCHFSNLSPQFDYVDDINSFMLGSSWNIIILVTVFEWITASYALLYYDPFDHWLQYEPLWWGLHPIPTLTSIWNFALLLIIWISRTSLNIPPNNAIIYTAALISTIVLHNYLAINRAAKIDKETEDTNPLITTVTNLKYDQFLRQRKPTKVSSEYNMMKSTQLGANFHESNFIAQIEKSSYGVVPRYLEYTITAPLLFVGLYVNSIPYDLTWKLQFMFVSLFACNALGIALHQAVVYIPVDIKNTEDLNRFTRAANYFFLATWLCLIAAFYLFVWSLKDFLLNSDYGMPDWVRWLIWLLLVLYAMFGFIASRYYLPRMIWATPITEEMYKWFYFYFDVCSLAIKLPVAWTIFVKGTVVLCERGFTCPTI
jgi:hypothetical protein